MKTLELDLEAGQRAAQNQGVALDPGTVREVVEAATHARSIRNRVSPRELEVWREYTAGLTRKEIAFKLGISNKTVDSHFDHLKLKLGVKRTGELIGLGYRYGLQTVVLAPVEERA